MVLGVLKIARDMTDQAFGAAFSAYHCLYKATPPDDANGGFNDGLRRETMFGPILEPKHISDQGKGINVSASIWQHSVRAHGAGLYLVYVLGLVAFTEDFSALAIREIACKHLLAYKRSQVSVIRAMARRTRSHQHDRLPLAKRLGKTGNERFDLAQTRDCYAGRGPMSRLRG